MRIFFILLTSFCFILASQTEDFEELDSKLKNNIWVVRYTNYSMYKQLINQLKNSQKELLKYKKANNNSQEKVELEIKIASLKEQTELLKEYEKAPFSSIFNLPDVKSMDKITNPIALIGGFSHIKQLKIRKDEYKNLLNDLDTAIEILNQKEKILATISDDNKTSNLESNEQDLRELKEQISDFDIARNIATTTFGVYQKRIDQAIAQTQEDIKEQVKQIFSIIGAIIAVILIGFLAKFIVKRYLNDNQRFYTINKFINVLNFIIIILILLFAYIENVSYLVTILGFASAGLAIAMKDMFMSLLGWCVIIGGGSAHVGDRIRVHYRENDYVGDIIDISLLRITIFEDVTYTTYSKNRRSGRIIFIPNNYIFTELIANYTHGGMKTVWDGIDVLLSFDSNHKKAIYIIKNIVRQYSRGYTDIARKQMNGLRDQYSIKNSNIEPRIFSFLEPYGMVISVWYQTNAYATLALRSTISSEIIDALKDEPDIQITFPKQNLYIEKNHHIMPNMEAIKEEKSESIL